MCQRFTLANHLRHGCDVSRHFLAHFFEVIPFKNINSFCGFAHVNEVDRVIVMVLLELDPNTDKFQIRF